MTIQELLSQSSIPAQYGVMDEIVDPPFIVYMGQSPDIFYADNQSYVQNKSYRIEYYFKDKNEELEEELEELLSSDGWIYDKSDDIYISSEHIFTIYYYIERMQHYGN